MMKRRVHLVLVLGVLASVFASGASATGLHAGTSMRITLLSPRAPVTVPENGKFPIRLSIQGLKLDKKAMGRKHQPGHGHFHFYVDCIPSQAYSQPNNFGNCWAGAEASEKTAFDLATSQVKVKPGTHVLLIALARNDHILYDVPPVTLNFTVVRPQLSIRVISPKTAVTVEQNGKIPIQLDIQGLTLDAKAMGRSPQAGHGHFHFYVDCVPARAYSQPNNFGGCWAGAEASEKTAFDLSTSQVKVKSGTHLLILALAQNNHVLYRVPAATISFTVLPAR